MQRTCSQECGRRLRYPHLAAMAPVSRTLRNAVKNAKRRQEILKDPEPYTLAEIARRDGYRCGLCHGKVDMSLNGMVRDGPTIDHVVPLSLSRDDRRSNVQLAHRFCNLSKGARAGNVQLALAG